MTVLRLFGRVLASSARFVVALGVLTMVWAHPASAQPYDESRGVIERQLEAFEQNAWEEAYSFAAPGIQRMFPTVDSFGKMVREGYPMVWKRESTEFLGAEAVDGKMVHRLRLVGADGRAYIAVYVMQQVGDEWLVAAVYIEQEQGLSA